MFETASGDAAAAEPDFLAAPEASSARNAKNTATVQSETLPRKKAKRQKAKVSAKVSMRKKGEPKIAIVNNYDDEEKEEEPFSDKLSNDNLEQTFVCRGCDVEKSKHRALCK